MSPSQPVISSDTGDLLIGNALTAEHRRVLTEVAGTNRMLIAAECNSWPVCYEAAYAEDKEHQACLTSHDACYPNSGVLLASSSTLLNFYDVWADHIVHSNGLRKAERWNDQAAVHRIYQNRSRYTTAADHSFQLQVDADNLFSLQLWKCDGQLQRKMKPFEYCHVRAHEPALGLQTRRRGREVVYTDRRGSKQRPFLVHSNGYHYVLRKNETHLAPLLDLYEPPYAAELLDHKVILVDTQGYGAACNITTVGWLMNATKAGTPWLHIQ